MWIANASRWRERVNVFEAIRTVSKAQNFYQGVYVSSWFQSFHFMSSTELTLQLEMGSCLGTVPPYGLYSFLFINQSLHPQELSTYKG